MINTTKYKKYLITNLEKFLEYKAIILEIENGTYSEKIGNMSVGEIENMRAFILTYESLAFVLSKYEEREKVQEKN